MSRSINFVDKDNNSWSEWEDKTLGELGQFYRGLSYDAQNVQESGNLVLRSTNIQDNNIDVSPNTLQFVNKEVPKHLRLIDGDIAICMANGSKRLVGKSATYNGEYDNGTNSVTVGAFCSLLRPVSSVVKYLLQTKTYSKEIDLLLAGSAINNLKNSDVEKIHFKVPSLPEQQKIAEFFSALDERIALTADKVKLLREQKAGYLQQVFNRELVFTDDNGDTYPEWEHKKLSDLSIIKRGASPRPIADERWFAENGQRGWVRISDISSSGKYLRTTTQYLSSEGIERSVKVEPEELILSIAGSVGKPAIVKIPVCIHDGFILFKNLDSNAEFIYYFLGYSIDKLKSLAQSGSQPNINSEIVGNLPIAVPALPEQEKIAEFFSALDERIELTENKLALLKEQKKGYLQGIFG